MARIEVLPEEFLKLLQEEVREDIVKQFKQFGFTYVTMDLTGYRMGSMNETPVSYTHLMCIRDRCRTKIMMTVLDLQSKK